MVSKCDLCNRTFKSSSELGRHVRRVHENQRHECGILSQIIYEKNTHLQSMKKLHTKVIITI